MELVLTQEIQELLEKQGQTLSTAESCTGGRLGQIITSISGSSAIYLGGIITYSDESKLNILHLPKRILQRHGAVSEQTAFYMAQNVKKLFGSSWGLSITGIAGPSGGSTEKPVGFICFGWSGPQVTITESIRFRPAGRARLQKQAAQHALSRLKDFISKRR